MSTFRPLLVSLTIGALVLSPTSAWAARKKRAPRAGAVFARHIDLAIQLDAQSKTLVSQRRAAAARHATANSLTPGSPYIAGSLRRPGRGSFQNVTDPTEPSTNRMREAELEVGMPIWLPGQRSALRGAVSTAVQELREKLAFRRLEIAGRIRDSWWAVQRTAGEAAIARERVSTARDIEHDIRRRSELGDVSPQDTLLARNETLSSETELIQATAAAQAARAAYRTIVGAEPPGGQLEPATVSGDISRHPAILVATAALARAEAQSHLVDATPIENPEIGIFGRRESSAQGFTRSEATTFGVRFRMSLPTAGRNEPRKAEATSEIIRAQSELTQLRRTVSAEVAIARAALIAARKVEASAAKRLAVASEQYEVALKSMRLGEINAFDLFRVRQLRLDAQRARSAARIEAGLAHSRLNQARGLAPGL